MRRNRFKNILLITAFLPLIAGSANAAMVWQPVRSTGGGGGGGGAGGFTVPCVKEYKTPHTPLRMPQTITIYYTLIGAGGGGGGSGGAGTGGTGAAAQASAANRGGHGGDGGSSGSVQISYTAGGCFL